METEHFCLQVLYADYMGPPFRLHFGGVLFAGERSVGLWLVLADVEASFPFWLLSVVLMKP